MKSQADIQSLLYNINGLMQDFVQSMDQAKPTDLGLDSRCGYDNFFVSDNCIVVYGDDDRLLQYYGGAEYIDKEFRREIGDYVIYLRDGARVDNWIDRYFENVEAEEFD